MSRKGPRHLTPEEQALWDKIADSASAMHPRRPAALVRRPDSPGPGQRAVPIPEFRIGEKHTETALPAARPNGDAINMDRKSFARMRRGKLVPDARIDLHGMTLEQAHAALNRFLVASQAAGYRLVLVITGKGKSREDHGPIPMRRGLLKHQVPLWLAQPPLSQIVLQVAQAHLRHGGGGAYYVYLRRQR